MICQLKQTFSPLNRDEHGYEIRHLKYIDRLEQDIKTLRTMVESLDEDSTTESSNDPIPAVLIDTDSPEELVAQFLVAAQQIDSASRDSLLSQLLHSSIVKHPPTMDSFLRFSFKTYKQMA